MLSRIHSMSIVLIQSQTKTLPKQKNTALLYSISFPGSSVGKESACSAGDLGSIPWLGRSLGDGKGYPLQYSGL